MTARTALAVAAVLGTVPLAAACDSGPIAEQAYCTTAAGVVVDSWHCDGTDPLYWYLLGSYSHPYRAGQTINVTHVHVTRIASANTAARRSAGLPASGRVTAGATIASPGAGTATSSSRSARTTSKTTIRSRIGGLISRGGRTRREQESRPRLVGVDDVRGTLLRGDR